MMINKEMTSKYIVFIAVMGALGNVFSALSIHSAPLIPTIPIGGISIKLNLDLSHLSTLIGALLGGPIVGAGAGLIGGAVAAYEFGFSQGNYVTAFALPIGKAMTGFTAGFLISILGFLAKRKSIFFIPTTLIAYIPEAIFTAFVFIIVFPSVLGLPLFLVYPITAQVLVKAFIEMTIIGVIIASLLSNKGFKEFASGIFLKDYD
jgi:hypothetical protein